MEEEGVKFVLNTNVGKDITAEELFATNQLKDSAELLEMINKNIAKLENMPEKLEIIYNLTQSLSRK